jgi:hypothetical protein
VQAPHPHPPGEFIVIRADEAAFATSMAAIRAGSERVGVIASRTGRKTPNRSSSVRVILMPGSNVRFCDAGHGRTGGVEDDLSVNTTCSKKSLNK